MKIAIIFNRRKPSGLLTRLFTGCYAYHCAWVDIEGNVMYDMNLLRRRRAWPRYPDGQVELFAAPGGVTLAYLEQRLTDDENRYGVIDYCLFAARWLYHLFGQSTRNAGGVICSEMMNNDIWACAGITPWPPQSAPPSPCDLHGWLSDAEGTR